MTGFGAARRQATIDQARDHANGQHVTITCRFCPFTTSGLLIDARARAAEHRRFGHPHAVDRKRTLPRRKTTAA